MMIIRPMWLVSVAAFAAFLAIGAHRGWAQARPVTAQEAAAVRACAEKFADNVSEGERRCVFVIVADPCTKTTRGQSNQGTAECYRTELAIWDDLLNENFAALRDALSDEQKEKLRDMQRAWLADRNATCGFYQHKTQGSMAIPLSAACLARETARRALLLKFFQSL
jgi:uncharacterized protein YecT (DUF1311 family)